MGGFLRKAFSFHLFDSQEHMCLRNTSPCCHYHHGHERREADPVPGADGFHVHELGAEVHDPYSHPANAQAAATPLLECQCFTTPCVSIKNHANPEGSGPQRSEWGAGAQGSPRLATHPRNKLSMPEAVPLFVLSKCITTCLCALVCMIQCEHSARSLTPQCGCAQRENQGQPGSHLG